MFEWLLYLFSDSQPGRSQWKLGEMSPTRTWTGLTDAFPVIHLRTTQHDGDSSDNISGHKILKLNGSGLPWRRVTE